MDPLGTKWQSCFSRVLHEQLLIGMTREFYPYSPVRHKQVGPLAHFRPSYTARASRSFFITPCFSSAEFQSGYLPVISTVRSIHALK